MGKGRDKKKKAVKAKSGGEIKGAKNKEKSGVKLRKGAEEKQEDELENIDELLQEFQKQQLDAFKVTEEINCAFPSRRVNASFTVSTVKPEEIILFGGEFFDGKRVFMYNDHFIYNTEKNEWKKILSPNSPGPRASHQCVASNHGYLFLFGGEFVSPNETNFFHYKDFWMLDLKTNEWEKLEIRNRPSPRSGHRMTKWKHYLVLFGGFFDQVHETKYLEDLWLFDTLEFKWIELQTPEPRPSARSGFQFLTHNDDIILYGGYSKAIMKGKKIAGVMHTDTWALKMNLDISLIKWERKKKSGGTGPGTRSGCTTIYHKGKGIMFGGVSDVVEDEETIESIVHSDFFQFNLDSNKFYPIQLKLSKKGDQSELLQPGARFNSMLAVSKNMLYLFGGLLEEKEKELTLNDFWTINADKMNEWHCLVKDETLENEWKGEQSDDEEDEESENEENDEEDSEANREDFDQKSENSQTNQDNLIAKYHEQQEFDPLPDPELEPKPGEKIGEYFERTSAFWLDRALKAGDFGGKVLRRVAFMQSERHYMDRLPHNEILVQQLKENEVAIEAAAAKKETEARQRNR